MQACAKLHRKEAAGLGSESVQAGGHSPSPRLSLDSLLPPRGLGQLTYVVSLGTNSVWTELSSLTSQLPCVPNTQSLFSVTLFTVVVFF